MSKAFEFKRKRLTAAEEAELNRQATKAGMNPEDWVEFINKAQIYSKAKDLIKQERTQPDE